MKKLIILMLLFVCVPLFAQSSRTEFSSGKYKNFDAAGSDTVFLVSTADNPTGGFLYGITINTFVAADSIYIRSGSDTLATLIFGASPPAYPVFIQYMCHIDSTLSVIRKKASNVTVSYRIRF